MNMRKLNTFASGVSSGIGQGSQIANRRKLLEYQGNEDARAEKRLGFQEQSLSDQRKFNEGVLSLLQKNSPTVAASIMGGSDDAAGRFEAAGDMPPTAAAPRPVQQQQVAAPSITAQPVPDARSFADNSANVLQGPPVPFGGATQPTLATDLLQQAQTPLDWRRLPFRGY